MINKTVREEKDILIKARTNLGLTQQKVADKADINIQQYQRFECGERKLSSSSFWIASKILKVLELDITTFAREDYLSNRGN